MNVERICEVLILRFYCRWSNGFIFWKSERQILVLKEFEIMILALALQCKGQYLYNSFSTSTTERVLTFPHSLSTSTTVRVLVFPDSFSTLAFAHLCTLTRLRCRPSTGTFSSRQRSSSCEQGWVLKTCCTLLQPKIAQKNLALPPPTVG